MTVAASYAVNLNSTVQEFNPPFTPRAVRITNYSGDNLAFDNTVDPVLLIPPGVVVPINIDHLVSTLRIRSATNTTGRATIQILDSQLDTSNAPNLQQLPGTITATIPSAVTVTGPGGGNVPSSDAATQALITTLNSLITTLNAISTTTQTNTGVLTGLLPSVTHPIALASGAQDDQPIAAAIAGFRVSISAGATGRLNVWVTSAGQDVYQLRDAPLTVSPAQANPLDFPFLVSVQAGGTIHTRWDDSVGALNGVLRY